MDDREELNALRRLAELEAKAGGGAPAPQAAAAPPQTFGQGMADLGTRAAKGAMFGPLGIQAAIAQHGMEALDHAAYKTGEGVSDYAAKYLPPEVAAGIGTAANVGVQAAPALMGGAAGTALRGPLQNAGRSLMTRAVNPILGDKLSGDAAKGVETMLQQGFNPTKGGVEAMRGKIAELGDQISEAVKNSTATINKNAVADRLSSAVERFKAQVNPSADLASIEKAWSEFLAHPDLTGKTDMPVQLAQRLKQGTYESLGKKVYGEQSGATTEAQKQLARGLKEEISTAVPGVAQKNTLQGELINAKDMAERRAAVESGKHPLGLGTSIAAIAHDPMAALGMWANSSAYAKSMLARMLYTPAPPMATGAGAAAGAALGPSGRAQ